MRRIVNAHDQSFELCSTYLRVGLCHIMFIDCETPEPSMPSTIPRATSADDVALKNHTCVGAGICDEDGAHGSNR